MRLSSDGASAQHAGEPGVHSRDHVRVLQRPGSLHRRSGTSPPPGRFLQYFMNSPSPSCPGSSGRPGAGCLLDVQTGGRADPDGDGDRQRGRSHARHPRGRCRFVASLVPFATSAPSNRPPPAALQAEGYVIGSCIKHIPIAGRDITYFTQQLLREREVGIPPEQSLETAKAVKVSPACGQVQFSARPPEVRPSQCVFFSCSSASVWCPGAF